MEQGSVRVDAWLWATRFAKTRSAATAACRAGHVQVGGERVKAAHPVRIGDEVRVRLDGRERLVTVTKLLAKRVGAAIAAECYEDHTPPPPPREERVIIALRDPGTGRPTKRDRRELDRLRGR